MGKSLRDQLANSGLVSKHQARQAYSNKVKNKKNHQNQKESSDINQVQNNREQHKIDSQIKNRLLETIRHQKEQLAQAKQIIEQHAMTIIKGEVPYHFVVNHKIKRIWIQFSTLNLLANAKIVICHLNNQFFLLPEASAKKVLQRAPELVLTQINDAQQIVVEYENPKVPDHIITSSML